MAKFARIPKLSKEERQKLLISFCEALTSINSKEEAAQFLSDLLGPQELEMLAKRLEIAKLLTKGKTYDQIKKGIKVSFSTIARVNAWLTLSGNGFRLVIERTKKKEKKENESSWSLFEKYDPYSPTNMKRRYSMYFLPELLIGEILKRSNERERNRLVTILDSIESKPEIFQQVNAELKEQFTRVRKLTKIKQPSKTTG